MFCSITAIKILNDQGFGRNTNSSATSHRLDLVFNPGGASLPPSQPVLETEYRRRLWDDHEITFDSLFTLTNMPIKRFADTLFQTGQYTEYMQLLANSFNASTIAGLMCRFTVNVAWDGKIYDCDFNAALDLGSQMPRQQDRTDTALDIWKLGGYNLPEEQEILTDLANRQRCGPSWSPDSNEEALFRVHCRLRIELRWCTDLRQ